MMTNNQRNVSLVIAILFFGGYAALELYRGRGRSAFEACLLGVLIVSAILRIARSAPRPPN
jgi:hypothetical protein